jgi:hypothetical protein
MTWVGLYFSKSAFVAAVSLKKGHGQINTMKFAEEEKHDGEVELLLPKVGVTRAGKNPGLAISASEA